MFLGSHTGPILDFSRQKTEFLQKITKKTKASKKIKSPQRHRGHRGKQVGFGPVGQKNISWRSFKLTAAKVVSHPTQRAAGKQPLFASRMTSCLFLPACRVLQNTEN